MWLGDIEAYHKKTGDSLQVEMTVYVLMDAMKVTTSKNKISHGFLPLECFKTAISTYFQWV